MLVCLLSACTSSRNLVYFSDLDNPGTGPIQNRANPKIQPDDVLSITVSSLSPESNALYNNGVLPQANLATGSMSAAPGKANEGYLVDKDGFINFPVLGNVKLAGLTKEEATAKLTSEISRDVKKPIINIRFLNFKVTVIGEVSKPSTFTIPTENINILEALALAGDLTPYGKRENILVIREKDGVRTTTRINLNNKSTLDSPYYYLQQNDIVYVEPDKNKEAQISLTRANTQFAISVGLSALSVLTILLTNISK